MANAVLEDAALGLGRLLEAAAIHVVHPAVEGTAEAAILDATVCERGEAMRAAQAEEAHLAFLVAEHDEALPQRATARGLPPRLEARRKARRNPVPTEPLPARGPRAYFADQLVLFLGQHPLFSDCCGFVCSFDSVGRGLSPAA